MSLSICRLNHLWGRPLSTLLLWICWPGDSSWQQRERETDRKIPEEINTPAPIPLTRTCTSHHSLTQDSTAWTDSYTHTANITFKCSFIESTHGFELSFTFQYSRAWTKKIQSNYATIKHRPGLHSHFMTEFFLVPGSQTSETTHIHTLGFGFYVLWGDSIDIMIFIHFIHLF